MGQLNMALVELPEPASESSSTPSLYLAASTPTPGWQAVPVEVRCGAFAANIRTARSKAVMGDAVTKLTSDEVEVRLIDEDQWLTSCDDGDLAGGANVILVGEELLQFADAEPLGAGRFRLSRLRRGLAGTEGAVTDHAAGELFLLISPGSMQPVAIPAWVRGSCITATHPTTGSSATKSRKSPKTGR